MKKLISLILCLVFIFSFAVFNVNATETEAEKADFVFMIDSTGSMGSYITSVKNNLISFANELKNKGVDLRIAIIEYKDIYEDGETTTKVHFASDGNNWFSDVNQVQSEFASINATGGGDTLETPWDAMFYTLDDDNWNWRKGASKYVFLLTDAGYKNYVEDGVDASGNPYKIETDGIELCINQYRAKNISVSVISRTTLQSTYEHLYSLTGGIFCDISSNNYYNLMLEISSWVVEQLGDADGDGIPDDWEINGADIDGDGIIDVDFPAMGADSNIPDIFVEVDWMYKPKTTKKILFWDVTQDEEINLKPSENALRIVYNQFKDHGINLHVDAGEDSVDFVTGKKWGKNSGGNALEYKDCFPLGSDAYSYNNWNSSAVQNFTRSRWNLFRYCMFISRFDGSETTGWTSGIAENIPGQFFIVCKVNTEKQVAGTFMHELGHTLGLKHGGNFAEQNYQANDLSIMNYLFQFSGLVGTNAYNYSEFELPALDETCLNENIGFDPNGLTAGTGLGTKIGNRIINNISGIPVDFDGDGDSTGIGVIADLNSDSDCFDVIPKSVNEWSLITYKGGRIGAKGDILSTFDEDVLIVDPNEDSILTVNDEISLQEAIDLGIAENPAIEDSSDEVCNYCGKIHSNDCIGRLVKFFHKIFWFFKNLFKA